MNWELVFWGTLAGFGTAALTFVGTLPVLLQRSASAERQNLMIGFAAGVMLSASYLSLIVPAAKLAQASGLGSFAAAAEIMVAVLVGAASLDAIRRSRWIRSAEARGRATDQATRRVSLLLLAMTAHNLPEGAAVGVSFGGGYHSGLVTALGIGIQDMPEGLAVAAALLTIGYSRWRAVLIGGATGLVEPIGAFFGVTLVSMVSWILPAAMGWAAGAMIYIVAAELLPAVHENGHSHRAIWAFLTGVSAMLFLDIALA